MGAENLAELIGQARRTVAFTGAGVSTESGVPDFRSPGGVWSRMQPILFQDFVTDAGARREAWRRVFSGAAGWTGRAPNQGHLAIARLHAAGRIGVVITQNVDNLHQMSGVPEAQVIELHGNAGYARCLACGQRSELEPLRAPFLETGEAPLCSGCGGYLKTATISFGQPMPAKEMARARTESLAADLFIVLGSSLLVRPAADLPAEAKDAGARLVIVNREPTPLDAAADLVLHAELGVTLQAVAEILLGPAPEAAASG
jgi:NAD-dependent deacetylase